MTVTLSEFEEFMDRLRSEGLEKITTKNLRRAIRHFWDVGSSATVDSRMETLKEEGWIEKTKAGDKWELQEEKENNIAQLMGEGE